MWVRKRYFEIQFVVSLDVKFLGCRNCVKEWLDFFGNEGSEGFDVTSQISGTHPVEPML